MREKKRWACWNDAKADTRASTKSDTKTGTNTDTESGINTNADTKAGTAQSGEPTNAAAENASKDEVTTAEHLSESTLANNAKVGSIFKQELSQYGLMLDGENQGVRVVKDVNVGSRAAGWGIKVGDALRNISDPSNIQVERKTEKFKVNLKVKIWS